ncbi:MAG: hypothetical protein AAGD15_16120 [Agrobacterium cavarae]|uniref:hypothetical protein n=1 Tax=Agrobacterium cavarae TaxID=2528239 RepID=UPI0031A9E5A9
MVFSVTKHRERQDSAVALSLPRWRLEVPFGIGEYLKTATANSKLDEPWGQSHTDLHCRTALSWPDCAMIIHHPMNRVLFDTYIQTQLVPALERGDVVILDTLAVYKSTKAAQALKEKGVWFLFLQPRSHSH